MAGPHRQCLQRIAANQAGMVAAMLRHQKAALGSAHRNLAAELRGTGVTSTLPPGGGRYRHAGLDPPAGTARIGAAHATSVQPELRRRRPHHPSTPPPCYWPTWPATTPGLWDVSTALLVRDPRASVGAFCWVTATGSSGLGGTACQRGSAGQRRAQAFDCVGPPPRGCARLGEPLRRPVRHDRPAAGPHGPALDRRPRRWPADAALQRCRPSPLELSLSPSQKRTHAGRGSRTNRAVLTSQTAPGRRRPGGQ